MKKLMVAAMVTVLAVSVGMSSAEAKRLGGGGSIGKQSQSMSRQGPAQSGSAAPGNSAKPAQSAAAPAAAGAAAGTAAKAASPWKGILGGALLGLGLGALLSHFGLSGAFASMIGTMLMIALLAAAVFFIVRMLRGRRDQAAPRPAWAGAGSGTPEIGSGLEQRSAAQPASWQQPAALQSPQAASSGQGADFAVPADFDSAGFLRHAKTYFIRLQAAWDRADVTDIREFTTPQMFAELKMQIQERGASANVTDVVSVEAELVGMENDGRDYLASVKFSGLIREAEGAPTEAFAEIWNLAKPISGSGGWVLAGIQQLQ